MKQEELEVVELFNTYVKNTWYAITVSFGSIAYSHNRKDKYSHILFLISFGFTITALMLVLKQSELISNYPEYFDSKLRTVTFIFMISVSVLLYISVDSIRTGYAKKKI